MPWMTGYPREKINWGPTIDQEKCVSCGMCLNCGKNVFEWKEGKPLVADYYQCVVGCSTCANLCMGKAISFPPLEQVLKIYRNEGIWAKVKKALIEAGKISE